MTKEALEKMIADFGDRIQVITFDNNNVLFIGFPGRPTINDISVETIGGTDFLVVHNTDPRQMSFSKTKITYKAYHPIECIQCVSVVDEEFRGYMIDPLNFK